MLNNVLSDHNDSIMVYMCIWEYVPICIKACYTQLQILLKISVINKKRSFDLVIIRCPVSYNGFCFIQIALSPRHYK